MKRVAAYIDRDQLEDVKKVVSRDSRTNDIVKQYIDECRRTVYGLKHPYKFSLIVENNDVNYFETLLRVKGKAARLQVENYNTSRRS